MRAGASDLDGGHLVGTDDCLIVGAVVAGEAVLIEAVDLEGGGIACHPAAGDGVACGMVPGDLGHAAPLLTRQEERRGLGVEVFVEGEGEGEGGAVGDGGRCGIEGAGGGWFVDVRRRLDDELRAGDGEALDDGDRLVRRFVVDGSRPDRHGIEGRIEAGIEAGGIDAVGAAGHDFGFDAAVAILVIDTGFAGGAIALGETDANVDRTADRNSRRKVTNHFDLDALGPGVVAEGGDEAGERGGEIFAPGEEADDGEEKDRPAAGGEGFPDGARLDSCRRGRIGRLVRRGFGDDAVFHHL